MPEVKFSGGGGDFKPGDQAPIGYLDWQEWAEIQHKAGLRQKECARCSLWRYPQELSDQTEECIGTTSKGIKVRIVSPVCNKCAAQPRPNVARRPRTATRRPLSR